MSKVSPFSNGCQHIDWDSANCDLCEKGYYNNNETDCCEIDVALTHAAVDDGTVSAEMAERMGYTRFEGRYNWPCLEFEPLSDERCNDIQRKRIAKRQVSSMVVELPGGVK